MSRLTERHWVVGSYDISLDGRHIVFEAVSLDRWDLGNGDYWYIDTSSRDTRNLTAATKG